MKSVLALCFSEANETYHHWRVFTPGPDGVCVEFKRDELLAAFDKITNLHKRAVQYKRMNKLKNFHPSAGQLPFLKRQPYKDGKEFRLGYIDGSEEIPAKGFDIDLTCIQRITLGPWMPRPLADPRRPLSRRGTPAEAARSTENPSGPQTTRPGPVNWPRGAPFPTHDGPVVHWVRKVEVGFLE